MLHAGRGFTSSAAEATLAATTIILEKSSLLLVSYQGFAGKAELRIDSDSMNCMPGSAMLSGLSGCEAKPESWST